MNNIKESERGESVTGAKFPYKTPQGGQDKKHQRNERERETDTQGWGRVRMEGKGKGNEKERKR